MEFGDQKRANLWPITDNFGGILEQRFSKEKENELTFDLLFRIYSAIYLDLSIKALSENLTDFANGYRFWNDDLLTEKGEPLTENSSNEDILNALVKLLKDNKSKADILVLKYIEKIEKGAKFTYEEIKDDIKRMMAETRKPAWKQNLIDKGLLDEDGKTVMNGLKETAAEHTKFTKLPITAEFIKSNFRQPNSSEEYSDSSCKAARDYANRILRADKNKEPEKRKPLLKH